MMVINNSKERRLAWSYSPTTTGGGGGAHVKSVLFNINWTGLWTISLSRQHQL